MTYITFSPIAARVISSAIVEGQIVGGIVHGIGKNALSSRCPYDENAQPLSYDARPNTCL